MKSLFRPRLLLQRLHLRVDLGVGGGEVARLRFLLQQRVGDEFFENLAVELVAPRRRNGPVIELDVREQALELSACDVFAVDVREDLRQLRRHWRRGRFRRRRRRRCGRCSGRGRRAWSGCAGAAARGRGSASRSWSGSTTGRRTRLTRRRLLARRPGHDNESDTRERK